MNDTDFNKKHLLLLFIAIIMAFGESFVYSQNFSTLSVKEKYDDVFIGVYNFPPSVLGIGDLSTTDNVYNLGQHGGVMESMLVMYEITGDKAYLYKFINWTDSLFALRGHSNSFLDLALCVSSSCLHFNARLLWPMAHFVYLIKVKKQSELYNWPMNHPPDLITNNSFSTFGAYAEWLYDRVEERLDWFLGINPSSSAVLWIDENRGFRHELSSQHISNGLGAAVMNFQAPWGMAMIYMYLSKPNTDLNHRDDYGVKAIQLARLYFNVTYNKCGDFSSQTVTDPVLRYNSENNSYWWYHDGWTLEDGVFVGGPKTIFDGNVGIGTTQLIANSILTVNGKISAEEIEVVQQVLPDYVFEKDYSLMTLKELENFINKNKHLPDVPTAEYVKNNGLQLGEMNAMLLQKIEELTLYLIQIEKDNIALKERISKLENNK